MRPVDASVGDATVDASVDATVDASVDATVDASDGGMQPPPGDDASDGGAGGRVDAGGAHLRSQL